MKRSAKPRKRRGVTAWLVTWECSGDHAKREDRIAAVLNPRLFGTRVKEIIEFLYMNNCYTLRERLDYALHPRRNPYPARFGTLEGHHPWEGQVHCGHNPFLFARMVDELVIDDGEGYGNENMTWKERPRPNLKSFYAPQ